MNKSQTRSQVLKGLLVIVLVVGLAFAAWKVLDSRSSGSVSSIENKVRKIAYVPEGENLRSTLLINTPDALDQLKKTSGGVWMDDAEVGDYYLAFSGRGVLYRPSSNKVISIIRITNSTPE